MRPWFLLAAIGCAAPPTPLIEAHRGAAGYYPQNSRTAVFASLEDGYAGLEFDVVLTADGVPVLHHDPWVHPTLCERVDGEPVGENVRIDGMDFATLTETFACGGQPDPDFPNAVLRSEPMLGFDELLAELRWANPSVLIHIDVKVEPGFTPPASDFADALFSRWFDADPPQRFYVSADRPETLDAFEAWGAAHAREIPTHLSWPRFVRDGHDVGQGLAAEASDVLGLTDPIAIAESHGFDGLALQWELASRSQVRTARAAGLDVGLWTVNDPRALTAHARWGVSSLITDFPGDLP